MRSLISSLAIAIALMLSATLTAASQLGNQAAGFSIADAATHQPKGGTNGYDVGATCLVADPTDSEAAYYYDGDEIRRYDFATGADIAAYDVPAIAAADAPGTLNNITNFTTNTGEVWGAFLRFDPSNANRLIFGESSQRALHELTLDATTRLVTSAKLIYQTMAGDDWAPFDATFLSTGALLLSRGGSINGDPFNRLTLVDTSTTPATLIDLAELPGYSGPVTVDSNGKLYYIVPQNTVGVTDLTHILLASWTSAQVAAAVADPSNDSLTVANATSERTPDLPSLSFITQMLARQEGSTTALYVGTYGTGVIRLDLATPANDSDVVDVINFASLSSFDFSSPNASWAPNLGPNAGGVATARLFVLTSQWVTFNDQPSFIARLGSDGGISDIDPQMVVFQPSKTAGLPYDGTANTTFSLTVTLRDELGEVIRFGSAANQQLAIEAFVNNGGVGGAGAAFSTGGGTAFAVNGVVTFVNLSFANAGSYILRVRDLAATTVMETTFEVLEIGSIALVSVTPASPQANQTFVVALEIRDQNGVRITSGPLASTILTLSNVAGPGAFLGSTAGQAVDGLVSFSDFAATAAGLFRLTFKTDTGTTMAGTLIEVAVQVAPATGGSAAQSSSVGGSGCALVGSGSAPWFLGLALLAALVLALRGHTTRQTRR